MMESANRELDLKELLLPACFKKDARANNFSFKNHSLKMKIEYFIIEVYNNKWGDISGRKVPPQECHSFGGTFFHR